MIIDWSANKYQQGFLCLGRAIPAQAYIVSRTIYGCSLYNISIKVLPEIDIGCDVSHEVNIRCKILPETNIRAGIEGGI